MKKAILNIKINVPDKFEPGNCKDCPFHSGGGSYYSQFDACVIRDDYKCKLGFNKGTCPIEISKE